MPNHQPSMHRVFLGAALGAATARAASSSATCFAPHVSSASTPPFSPAEVAELRGYFRRNLDVNGTGAVVAAPDNDSGPGGDYYFHWERDGALSMEALLQLWPFEEAKPVLRNYASWVQRLHRTPDRHGIDVLSEPKFHIRTFGPETEASNVSARTVTVFGGSWCRPQNDGAGLRARALMHYAERLLESGDADFVREYLWTGQEDGLKGGLIKADLEWVAQNWNVTKGCDLWEEDFTNPTAEYFWIQYTMRYAMQRGADFAARLGDAAAQARFQAVADVMTDAVQKYWNGDFVYECDHRPKDSAVVEAFLVGDLQDGLFSPLSEPVLKTVLTLNDAFCQEYAINRADTANGIPGIMYGRYPGDVYNGGNPWVLLSASLASLIYRQAALAATAAAPLDPSTYDLLVRAYVIPRNLSGIALGDALLGAGDGILLRLKHHALLATPEGTTRPEHIGGMHMAEQIERSTGQMTSAEDLTWNYANLLKALKERDAYLTAVANLTSAEEASGAGAGRRLSQATMFV